VTPVPEEIFNGFGNLQEAAEIAVVQTQAPDQLPDPLDRIEVRAVRRQEVELEAADPICAPVAMELGVVVFGIVSDDHHAAPRSGADPVQVLEEVPAGLRVEALALAAEDEAAVAQAHGTKVAHTLAPRKMPDHGISNLWRYPHAAT